MSRATRIRIRTYDAGHGNCFLVRLPDRDRVRTLLVDFGRAVGADVPRATARSITDDISEQCGGQLDVVVVSGEHGSHLSGLLRGRALFRCCPVSNVWMGMSSHPDYYDEYPKAGVHKTLQEFGDEFTRVTGKRRTLIPALARLVESSRSNPDGLTYARAELGETTWFLARGADMRGTGLGKVMDFHFSKHMPRVFTGEATSGSYSVGLLNVMCDYGLYNNDPSLLAVR